MKQKDTAEHENEQAFKNIPKMGYKSLLAQVESKVCSPEFKAACQAEIDKRKADRKASEEKKAKAAAKPADAAPAGDQGDQGGSEVTLD